MKYVAILASLFALPSGADEITDLCRERWGSDYVMLEHCISEQRAAKARLGVAGLSEADRAFASVLLEAHNNWKSQRGVAEELDDIVAMAPTHRASAVYVECYRGAGGGNLEGLRNLVKCLVAADIPADGPK